MARAPALQIVDESYMDDVEDIDPEENVEYMEEDAEEEASVEQEFGIDLETAVNLLQEEIRDAVNFMVSDIFDEYEEAEDFFAGMSNIPKQKGRSQVTATEVRDAIRSIKPNAIRVFLTNGQIVEYIANFTDNPASAVLAHQQTVFANNVFWESGGYELLINAFHNACLKRIGPMKAYAVDEISPHYMTLSNLTDEQFVELEGMEDVDILDVEQDDDGIIGDIKVGFNITRKVLKVEHVHMNGFFFSDDSTTTEDGRVIGERSEVTVGEALEMGIDYDGDWMDLDSYDIELNDASTENETRKGYTSDKKTEEELDQDPSLHKFLLTEVYARYDLQGIGIPQLYRFYMGGSNYEYLDHEIVEENPYAVGQIDPLPDSFMGRSIHDILKEDQNTLTSLLRATCDNAHLANNSRLAVHESLVNLKDVMSPILGHPVRFRAAGMIQEIKTESSVAAMLPLIQHIEMKARNKVGVTDASLGLDPDALQSTDKDAVKNTIELSQGQIEYMVRNFAETGLAPLFNKLLRLSIRHLDREQHIEYNGDPVVVDTHRFNTHFNIRSSVGLGTGSTPMQMAGLQQIIAEQKEIAAMYGFDNPLAPVDKMYKARMDYFRLHGISNLSVYFNPVDNTVAKQLDAMMAQKQKEAEPEKPSAAMAVAEEIKGRFSIAKTEMELGHDAQRQNQDHKREMIRIMLQDDAERDKMIQNLAIEDAKLRNEAIDKALVLYEQRMNNSLPENHA